MTWVLLEADDRRFVVIHGVLSSCFRLRKNNVRNYPVRVYKS